MTEQTGWKQEQTERKQMLLYEKLMQYGDSDHYPYHMPGHKRRKLGAMPEQILRTDITEIDGFDNLHEARGILREAQDVVNALYGAEETWFLVNGSTCGILSAVSAALPDKGHLLITRSSHKSVYHAAYLRQLRLSYLYPEINEEFGFSEAVTPGLVQEALNRESDIGAVLIVSPTYEGRIADVAQIAEVVHAKGIPLIVDEAHGAHLGFAEGFAESSCTTGADLVIHSVHKTLPAMTQTALLHVNGKLIDRDRLRRFLRIYQTSSPSYVLMASICDAMEIMEKDAANYFAAFRVQYIQMTERLQTCRVLSFVPQEDMVCGRQDIGKLVIGVKGGQRGQWLYDVLREKYHLQCEMAAGTYCLAMFTVADGAEAYDRMARALLEIDDELVRQDELAGRDVLAGQGALAGQEVLAGRNALDRQNIIAEQDVKAGIVAEGAKSRYPFCEAWDMSWRLQRFSDAVGCAVAEFVNLYPPGTPILVPGEVLTEKLYWQILSYQEQNLNLQGLEKKEGEYYIRVLEN